jgi:hypothetical protein
LVFEFKGPVHGAEKIDVLGFRQRIDVVERFGGVGSVEGAVSIGILRIVFGGTCGAAFGIGLAEDDGSVGPFWK